MTLTWPDTLMIFNLSTLISHIDLKQIYLQYNMLQWVLNCSKHAEAKQVEGYFEVI